MDRGKPLFMKTYGKHSRKIDAWISPDNRRQAFESSLSSGVDSSVFDPSVPRESRMGRGRRKGTRPPAAQRKKPTSVRRRTTARPPLDSSESEPDTSAPKGRKGAAQRKEKQTSNGIPSAGRFVTRRRAVRGRPSSDDSGDFVSGRGAPGSRLVLRRRGRRVPPGLRFSVSEMSEPVPGRRSSVGGPAAEAECSLGPCPRKPLFCSTPSASVHKAPRPRPSPTAAPSAPSPLSTLSRFSIFSTSQEDLDSPGDPFPPPPPAVLRELSSLGESQTRESSSVLGAGRRHSSARKPQSRETEDGGLTKSREEDTGVPNATPPGHPDPSRTSLAWEETSDGSGFVSAPAGLDWLTEALKHVCLTKQCSVPLERVENMIPGLLHSQSTYSSCLDQSCSGCLRQTATVSFEDGRSADPPQSQQNRETLDTSQCVLAGTVACVRLRAGAPGSQITNGTRFTDLSVVCVDSSHHIDDDDDDGRVGCASGPRSPEDSPPSVEPVFTHCDREEREAHLASMLREECLLRRCSMGLQRADVSQLPGLHTHTAGQRVQPPEMDSAAGPDPGERGRARRRRIAARRTTVVLDQGGGEAGGAPEPTALPEEPGVDPAPEILQPAEAEGRGRPRRSVRTRSSKEGGPAAPGALSPLHNPAKRKVLLAAPGEEEEGKKKKQQQQKKKARRERSLSKDRSGATRKVCVSGLSVSRWRGRGDSSTLAFPSRVDCSITELLSGQHNPSTVFTQSLPQASGALFSTPPRAGRLNLSSMLLDLTPNTHTWSRLKAALSVHRKTRVFVTPGDHHSSRPGSVRRAPLGDLSLDLFASPTRTPLCERRRPALPPTTSLSVCDDDDDDDEDEGLSDAQKVYTECGQPGPLSWEQCVPPHRLERCLKIGEGTFGEVFSTTNALGDMVALKIIPVDGSVMVNGEQQKTFGEILHEIIISKELSNLRNKTLHQTSGFIGLNDLHCVQGCYPPSMLDAWDAFHRSKGSENDRPDFFEEEQFFLILEFEFGGSDLENSNGTLPSLQVAKSILHQVTAALAVAEQELHFEHRDLHWGNVLVKTTKVKKGSFLLGGTNHCVDTKGVLVHIIDFSLSRLEIDGLTVSCDISTDEELFMGQGDYQFDIYRLMRQANGNNWSDYQPRSNVMWLHYLSAKLLSMKYRRPGGRGTKGTQEELTRFHDNLLQYSSATDALQNCPLFQ